MAAVVAVAVAVAVHFGTYFVVLASGTSSDCDGPCFGAWNDIAGLVLAVAVAAGAVAGVLTWRWLSNVPV